MNSFAASRYTFSSPTNSTTPMVYVCSLPVQKQLPIQAQSGPELFRRELLQNRMPPRGGIQSIVDRRRAERDPWLDDEHD
jgi:hypothetical protein